MISNLPHLLMLELQLDPRTIGIKLLEAAKQSTAPKACSLLHHYKLKSKRHLALSRNRAYSSLQITQTCECRSNCEAGCDHGTPGCWVGLSFWHLETCSSQWSRSNFIISLTFLGHLTRKWAKVTLCSALASFVDEAAHSVLGPK